MQTVTDKKEKEKKKENQNILRREKTLNTVDIVISRQKTEITQNQKIMRIIQIA